MTKAATSAARAQPSESRDRKYDKHLSYSATWGRLAGQAGSRGGGWEGAGGGWGKRKIRPRGAVSTLPAGFSRQTSREGGGSASAAETLSDACASGHEWPSECPRGRMKAPAGGGDKSPLSAVSSAQHLKWVTKSRVLYRNRRETTLQASWQASAAVQTRRSPRR